MRPPAIEIREARLRVPIGRSRSISLLLGSLTRSKRYDGRELPKSGHRQWRRRKLIAWTLAKKGEKTIAVERSIIGGSCVNVACLPSKNVIYAKAVSLVDPKTGLGVTAGPTTVDMAGVARRKQQMIDELVQMHLSNFKQSGAELVMGEARFTKEKTVAVKLKDGGTRSACAANGCFWDLAPARPIPAVPGLAEANPMTHVEALKLQRRPEHLIVLGGGTSG